MNKILQQDKDNYLESNLSLIEKRWPHLAQAIRLAPQPQSVQCVGHHSEKTLVIDGLHIASAYSRVDEARLQARLVPEESPNAWVYGVGLGDLPRALLLRGAIKQLGVVLLSYMVAHQSFIHFDHREWLGDPRVNLVATSELNALKVPFASVPPELLLADEEAARLRDLVFLELSTPYIQSLHSTQDSTIAARIWENEPFLRADGDAQSLFDSHQGQTIHVAAAGPSLSDHYAWLAKHREDICLLAVDSALAPLTAAGIRPDVVVCIDGSRELVLALFEEIDPQSLSKIPLLYFPIVHSDVLSKWPGPRLAAYSRSDIYREISQRYRRGQLYAAGSVLHPTVDLAVKMGAARVVLMGADFCYPQGQSHVAGSAHVHKKNDLSHGDWVLNGQGRRCATSPNLRGFLRDLEAFIETQPHVSFFRLGNQGAAIRGAELVKEPT